MPVTMYGAGSGVFPVMIHLCTVTQWLHRRDAHLLSSSKTWENKENIYFYTPHWKASAAVLGPNRPAWVTADLLAGGSAVRRQMDRLSVWLNTRPKQSVCSSILSKGSTFSLEKPPKWWNMVYYCMTGFSKCVRLMNVLRIELLFEK